MTVRTRTWVGLLATAAVATAVVAARGWGDHPGAGGPVGGGRPPATAVVARSTLVATERVSGTLGYGSAYVVSAHSGAGTVTWLPSLGSTVTRGRPVYRVDNQPVTLLYGDVPLYRSLRPGLAGPDVRQVEENLAALGYADFTVDSRYTAATATAVARWQADGGVPPTGKVEPGRVVVAPGEIRVSGWHLAPGDPAAGPILSYTGTTRVVTVGLAVGLQTLVRPTLPTTITLPDGRTTAGTVVSVGRVATIRRTATADPVRDGDGGGAASIDVTVAVTDQAVLGTLDSAPVQVAIVSASAENVLCVPVAALVVLAGGGYAVEVVDGGTARNVAVRTGMFADGRVEISGPGITEGTVVGMPE